MATPEHSRTAGAGGKATSRSWLGVLVSPIQMVGSMLSPRPAQQVRPSQLFPGDHDVPMPSSNSSMPAPAEAPPPPTAPVAPTLPAPAAPMLPTPAAAALPAPAAPADRLHTAAPGSPVQGRMLLRPSEQNWSDRKKASLDHFLRVHQSQEQPPANALPAAAQPDPARPYMGLKWLLSSAHPGIELPTTWTASQPQQTWQPQPVQQRAWPARPVQAVMPQARAANRFAPYGLTRPAERPRGDAGMSRGAGYGAGPSRMAAGLPSTPTASPAIPVVSFPQPAPTQPALTPVLAGRDAAVLAATPATAGPPQALALTPSTFTFNAAPQAPAATTAGRSTARRAVTFGAAGTPAPALVPMAITPHLGKPNAGANPAVGRKRAADGPAEAPARTPARTPLVGSGMNLSEYKKQRRQNTQTPSSHWLARGATGQGTPRDRGDGAGSSRSNSASAAATPTGSGSVTPVPTLLGLTPPGMAQGTSPGQTEAARRILETLENYPKSDNTPVTLNKTAKPGRPGATPYHSAHPPPPLDHISPGAATPTTSTGRRYGLYDYDRPTSNGAGAPLALTPSRPTATDNGTMASPDAVMPAAAMGSGGPAADLLEGLKPAGSGRARSADRHPKSVRFSGVPDEEAGKAPAAARVQMQAPPHVQANAFTASPEPARPAASERREAVATFGLGQAQQQQQQQQAGASPRDSAVPHFTFGTDPSPADAQAAQQSWSVICTLPAGPVDTSGIKNTFAHPISAFECVTAAAQPEVGRDAGPAKGLQFGGVPAGRPAAQAFNPPEATLSQAALIQQQEELRQAAAVPLPDTDEDEPAPAQAPTASNAAQLTPAATPAPVASSGGWGDLLQSNLAAQAAANRAIASEIEKAKNPAPAATPTNGFAFGFGNSAPSPTPSFSHGVPLASATVADAQSALTGNGAADGQAGQQQQQAEPQPAAAAPAAASSGWDMSFLQKTQNGIAQASNAAAKAIEDAAKGASTPPPSTTAGPSFGVSPLISFGASTTAAPAQTPSFGQLSPPPFGLGSTGTPNGTPNLMSPAPDAAPAFSFGASAAQPAATGSTTMPSPTFGASAPATSTFNFGSSPFPAPSQSQPQFGSALSPAPFFGSTQPSTFASGQAGASASTPSFGAAAPAQEQQPSSSPAMFSFGATPARPTTATAGTPNTPTFFGAAQTPAPTAGTASAWAPAQPAAAAPATTSFQFGASAASTTLGLGGSGFTFGSSAPAATPPASTGGFMFGAQPQLTPASPAPALALSPAPGFGAPPAQGFAGAGTGFFGLSPTPAATPPANTFGQPGGTPFPIGGGGPPSVSPFGGAGGGFGATPSPQAGFGGLATPPTLGAMNANAGSTPFPFGGGASGQAPGFGAGIAQPVFGATPSPAPAGGSGMGMNLTDMKSGERRKVHARRNK